MTVAEPRREDAAGEVEARIDWANARVARQVIAALLAAGIPSGHVDARALRRLQRADVDRLKPEEAELLRILAWRWRRKLAPHLAPRLPPNDPVVRALRARGDIATEG